MSSGEWLVTPLSAQADPVMTSSEDEYSLEPNFIFGLTTMPSNSCLFQTDDKVIYRSSGVLAIHDVEQKSQRFLHMNDRLKVITAMDINHHKLGATHYDTACFRFPIDRCSTRDERYP
jgi:energy-converting hydrogenase Eha subunit H